MYLFNISFPLTWLVGSIDKVYIDGPLEYFQEIDSRTFYVIGRFPGPIVLQTFELGNSRAQPYCIHTDPIGPKMSHVIHSFKTRKQNTG